MTEHLTNLPKIPKELEPLAEEARKYKSAEGFVNNQLKRNLQTIADKITDKYGVSQIKIETSDLSAKGKAVYHTERIKGGKIHFPKNITIYEFKEVMGYPGELTQDLAHELAHHILNKKTGTLQHTPKHGELEDEIGLFIEKNLQNLLNKQQLTDFYNQAVKGAALFKVGEPVQQKNIYTGEIINKGKITKVVRLSTPATGFVPKNYYEIEGKGLVAEDLLEAVQKENPKDKEPWQLTKVQWLEKYTIPLAEIFKGEYKKPPTVKMSHKEAVEKALREDKPVPAKVLKDYPELARLSKEHLT